jgi:hypothetical protein
VWLLGQPWLTKDTRGLAARATQIRSSAWGEQTGKHEPEFQASGYPYNHLASRFEEALKIILPLD